MQVLLLVDVMPVAEMAGSLFSNIANRRLAIDAVTALSAICKHLRRGFGTKAYLAFLKRLGESCRATCSENAVVALAFAIEQAPSDVIDAPEFNEVCSTAAEAGSDLRYRNDSLVGERWTLILPTANAPAVELVVLGGAGARAATAVGTLLLWAKRHSIVKQMGRYKWRRLGIQIAVLSVEESKRRAVELPSYISEEAPCALARLTDPADERTPLPFFVCDDFLNYADRNTRPDNRCSLWVLMQLLDGIIQNFTHFKFPRRRATRLRGQLIYNLFGMRRFGADHAAEASDHEQDDAL
jgi:hypothetical protein